MAGLKRKYGTSAFVGRRRLSEKVTGGRPRGFRGGAQFARRALLGLMEKKVVETASASYACDTTGSVTLVNGMAQGSDFTNRIGRKYTNVAVQLEGYLGPQDSNVGTTKCRIMLIYDAQPNGALPAITDVLTASTSNAFMNLNNRDRFKVLCDENYTLGQSTTRRHKRSPAVRLLKTSPSTRRSTWRPSAMVPPQPSVMSSQEASSC